MESNSLNPDRSISAKLGQLSSQIQERIEAYDSDRSKVKTLLLLRIEEGIRIGWMLTDAKELLKGSSELFGDWCKREIPGGNDFIHKMMKIGKLFKRDYQDCVRRKECGIGLGGVDLGVFENWENVPSLSDQIEECRCGTFREILVVNGLMPAREVSTESGSTVQTGIITLWSFFVTSQTRMQKIMRTIGEDVTQWNESDRVATLHKLKPFVELYTALLPRPKQAALPPASASSSDHNYPMQQTLNRFGR